jgi:hypothetical protein
VEHRYHQPTDEYLPGMDFSGDAKMAMFGYELGVQAASQPKLIGWQPGDVFDAIRKRSQPTRPTVQNKKPSRNKPRKF